MSKKAKTLSEKSDKIIRSNRASPKELKTDQKNEMDISEPKVKVAAQRNGNVSLFRGEIKKKKASV